MSYRVNGKKVTREEFLASCKGFDYSRTPNIQSDYEAYNCPVTGRPIDGRAAHKENLKKHGCRLFEAGEREDFIKNREADIRRNSNKVADFLCDRIAEQF